MKKDFVASAVVVTLAMAMLSTLVGCGSSSDSVFAQNSPAVTVGSNSAISIDPALLGRWKVEEGQPHSSSALFAMDLLNDGTGVSGGMEGVPDSVWGRGFTWRAENGRFYLFLHNLALGGGGWNYKISEETLTLTTDGGRSSTYKKR